MIILYRLPCNIRRFELSIAYGSAVKWTERDKASVISESATAGLVLPMVGHFE